MSDTTNINVTAIPSSDLCRDILNVMVMDYKRIVQEVEDLNTKRWRMRDAVHRAADTLYLTALQETLLKQPVTGSIQHREKSTYYTTSFTVLSVSLPQGDNQGSIFVRIDSKEKQSNHRRWSDEKPQSIKVKPNTYDVISISKFSYGVLDFEYPAEVKSYYEHV